MNGPAVVETRLSPASSTGSGDAQAAWLWFLIAALGISVLAGLRIADTDIWFHLRNAKEMVDTHSLLHRDSYTFTTAGAPLINFEWLSELPYYFAFQLMGLRGLLAVCVAMLWLTFGGAYYLALIRGADPASAALLTIAGALVGTYSLGPRMFHFGYACFVAVLLVLEHFQTTGKGLWVLPTIFALWINLHASWVYGFVVLAIYIVSGLTAGRWHNVITERWMSRELRSLLVASAASAAALFVNPYGFRLVMYPFELLSKQTAVRDYMTEWQSVDFHTFWGKLAMLTLLGLLAAAWFSPEPWQLRDVLLAVLAIWSALTHMRFLLFAGIVLVPILAPRLHLLGPTAEPRKSISWPMTAAIAAVLGLIVWTFPTNARLANIVDSQFPRDALHFMQQNHLDGRLFHYYGYGGYIEWYAPTIKTFADARTDIFIYNGVLADYLKIDAIDQPLELLDKYKIDLVLFPLNKRLVYVLDHSPDWHTIYQDNVVKLYERKKRAS